MATTDNKPDTTPADKPQVDLQFEQIIPWNGQHDSGKDVRLKWARNFERVAAALQFLLKNGGDAIASGNNRFWITPDGVLHHTSGVLKFDGSIIATKESSAWKTGDSGSGGGEGGTGGSIIIDTMLSMTSENPVQNRVISIAIGDMSKLSTLAKTSLVDAINEVLAKAGNSGVNAESLWQLLGADTTEQINKSHLTNALRGYLTSIPDEYITSTELDEVIKGLNLHTHTNKAVLDKITAEGLQSWDKVVADWSRAFYFDTKGNLRAKLNLIGEKEIAAWQIGDSTDHPSTGLITIVDNLFSTSAEAALSANQGRVLKQMIEDKTVDLTGYATENWVRQQGYATSSSLTGYAKKDGSNVSGTWNISISGTAAKATDADTVDGIQASAIPYAVHPSYGYGTSEESGNSQNLTRTMFWRDNNRQWGGSIGVYVCHSQNNDYAWELRKRYDNNHFITSYKSGGVWQDENTIAFTTDNVASATRLAHLQANDQTVLMSASRTDGTQRVEIRYNGSEFEIYKKSGAVLIPYAPNTSSLGNAANYYRNIYTHWLVSGTNEQLVLGADNGEAIWILTNQNVGIGTNNPTAKLDVNGNIKARGELYANDKKVWHAGNLEVSDNIKQKYTIDLSDISTNDFYPIYFAPSRYELDCEIHSPSVDDADPFNQNHIHFLMTSKGWADTRARLIILSQGNYRNGEISIGSIGKGEHNGGIAVWVRGGLKYVFTCNRVPLVKKGNVADGDEFYAYGTNIFGGTSRNVTIVWRNDDTRDNHTVVVFDKGLKIPGDLVVQGNIKAFGEITAFASDGSVVSFLYNPGSYADYTSASTTQAASVKAVKFIIDELERYKAENATLKKSIKDELVTITTSSSITDIRNVLKRIGGKL